MLIQQRNRQRSTTAKPAEEGIASRAGVTKTDLDRPSIRQLEGTRLLDIACLNPLQL